MLQAVLCCIYALLFVFIISKHRFFRLPGLSLKQTLALFIIKIIVGTIVWEWFVIKYPMSDSLAYFRDSKILYDLLFENPSQFFHLFFGMQDQELARLPMSLWRDDFNTFLINDSRTFIRLNTIFHFFSFSRFHVHTVFVCFLSFTGLVHLYKLFYKYVATPPYLIVTALFLFPSVVFWSSIVLKESMLFLGLGLLLYHTECGLKKTYTLKNGIGLLTGTLILIGIKMYVLIALSPALFANVWIAQTQQKHILMKYAICVFCFLVCIFNIHHLFPAVNLVTMIKNKQTAFVNVAKGGMLLCNNDGRCIQLAYETGNNHLHPLTDTTFKLKTDEWYASFVHGKRDTLFINGIQDTTTYHLRYSLTPSGSRIDIEQINASEQEFARKSMRAFCSVLLLPELKELDKPFATFLFIENSFLLFLLICIICFFRRSNFSIPLLLFCFSYVIFLFCLIGLTTPVLGALVRYRVPAIPFLIIGTAVCTDPKKIGRLLSYFKIKS